jgi:flagellar biosynthesis/type III secretory pathway protein FliH
MYPLLPTMLGFHADMAVQAMSELSERYRDDRATLIEQFICMQLCMERTETIELEEKIHIKRRLSMFDQLWEESPTIQKMRAESLQKGLQEGVQQGLQEGVQALQDTLVDVVRTKYPDLVDLAQQQASHFDKPDTLRLLIQQVLNASNADIVQFLLEQKTT